MSSDDTSVDFSSTKSIIDRCVVKGIVWYCVSFRQSDKSVWINQDNIVKLDDFRKLLNMVLIFNSWFHQNRRGNPPADNEPVNSSSSLTLDPTELDLHQLLNVDVNDLKWKLTLIIRESLFTGYLSEKVGFLERGLSDRRLSLLRVWNRVYNEWSPLVDSYLVVLWKDIISFKDGFGNTKMYSSIPGSNNIITIDLMDFENIDFNQKSIFLIEFSTPKVVPRYGIYVLEKPRGIFITFI